MSAVTMSPLNCSDSSERLRNGGGSRKGRALRCIAAARIGAMSSLLSSGIILN